MRKLLLCGFIFLLVGYGTYQYCRYQDRQTDGFTLERIAPTFADQPDWDIASSKGQIERANAILRQPFYYLGHGFQCYAFASKDGKYVLKFIRQQRLRPPILYDLLPNIGPFKKFKAQRAAQGKKRADYLFRSLKVAYIAVPQETGLVFVHLNKTKGVHPTVTLFDKAGTLYEVDLDGHEFVLQRRAEEVKPTLVRLMKEGDFDVACRRIDQIFDLLATCAKKGVADNDSQLIRKNNLGFLKNRAIYIDTGKIALKESMKTKDRFKEDLDRLKPLYEWLHEHYPTLAEHFLHEQNRVLVSFLNN